MKTLCIYHSRDLDGWMSAAIVKKHFIDSVKNTNYIITDEDNGLTDKSSLGIGDNQLHMLGWDYSDDIPSTSEYDKVVMCDVSFPKEHMLAIANTKGSNFIWIDHHQRSVDEINDYLIEHATKEIDGLITEPGELKAACELTWYFFYPDDKIPEIVRLLGAYDCFRHKGLSEEQKVLEFQYGARSIINNYQTAFFNLNKPIENTNNILGTGGAIYNYLCTEAKQIYAKAFIIKLIDSNKYYKGNGGSYKFLCVNQERFNPINFGIDYHKDGYDGFACFWYKDGKWNFSLYSNNGKVDCSAIAKSFGGSGHKGVAGFVIEDINQFKSMLKL